MPHHDDTPEPGRKMHPNTDQERIPVRSKGRKFFQQMQPTFAVDLPSTTTRLEFLDENDPAKDKVVRKKAREWVNKNKKLKRLDLNKQVSVGESSSSELEGDIQVRNGINELQRRRTSGATNMGSPTSSAGSYQFDCFSILPDVGRDYKNIVDFFLNGCPEEIPCSDDKYAQGPNMELVGFCRDNTVLGNMAKSKVAFIVWLYATVTIRNGILGSLDTEEVGWFYNQALKGIQNTLKKEAEAGVYSDHLLNAMGCITATASFSGMFETAALHRDATLRVLTLRGGGDILDGMKSLPRWTAKALQWCEIMVSTQLVETPIMPYYHPSPCLRIPEKIKSQADKRTADTLSHLPTLSEPLQHIVNLLHHLGIAYADPHPAEKVDSYIIRPLYDAEYAILQILEAHRKSGVLSDTDALLAETFQIYFWFGLRTLPPQTRLGDLLVSRLMTSLLPFVHEGAPKEMEASAVTARWLACTYPIDRYFTLRSTADPKPANTIITWCLTLGTKITAALNGPEHLWLKGHWAIQMHAMGLSCNDAAYQSMLETFPDTGGFPWIALRGLVKQLQISVFV